MIYWQILLLEFRLSMEGEVERRSQDLTTLASRLANLVDNQAKVRTLYVVSLHDWSPASLVI